MPPDDQDGNRPPRRAAGATRSRLLTYLQQQSPAGRSPSRAEMAVALNISRQNVDYHIRELARRGLVEVLPGYRGVMLTTAGRSQGGEIR